MYCSTKLSVRRICDVTHTNLPGFRYYLHRYHRVLARYGVQVKVQDVETFRLRRRCGQTAAARIKHEAAIEACGNAAYLRLDISQIARLFHLNGTSLADQLRIMIPRFSNGTIH